MIMQKEKICLCIFLLLTTVLLTVSCYYSKSRYVGDTAIFAQLVENIARTGKAESNIFANTQDNIDRSISAMQVEERLASESAFEPPLEQSRNMLHFHSYFILYLLAPFCYFMSGFSCVTIAQSAALAFSLFFCILIMRNKGVPYPLVIVACVLLTAHPGWSMPTVRGAFYPDRLFMGTGMYLVWACEKEQFHKIHFIAATILCMLVGERGALYAGMFILAYTIFYWKDRPMARGFRLVMGSVAVVYAGVVMKFFLDNMFYSGIGNIRNFTSYLSIPENMQKVVLFLLINFLFLIAAVMDWRALIIGIASMIPNLLYNVGGAEKIGWTLHYHVFYFVFLMWAVTRGLVKLYGMTGKRTNSLKAVPYIAAMIAAIMVSLINPTNLNISFSVSNLKNNFMVACAQEIRGDYFQGGKDLRQDFNALIDENIPAGSAVSTIEAGMCALLNSQVYIFPIGIKDADYAVVAYQAVEEGYSFSGSVVFGGAGSKELFDQGVALKMGEYGYDLDNPILFPQYGIAILKRSEPVMDN